jgi:hypothetical protein
MSLILIVISIVIINNVILRNVIAGMSNGKGRLSTVDVLALTSLDQLVFIMRILFTFLT